MGAMNRLVVLRALAKPPRKGDPGHGQARKNRKKLRRLVRATGIPVPPNWKDFWTGARGQTVRGGPKV
jgi:hypothetical protein